MQRKKNENTACLHAEAFWFHEDPWKNYSKDKMLYHNAFNEVSEKTFDSSWIKWEFEILHKKINVDRKPCITVFDRIYSKYRDCGISGWNPTPFPIPSRTRIPSRSRSGIPAKGYFWVIFLISYRAGTSFIALFRILSFHLAATGPTQAIQLCRFWS